MKSGTAGGKQGGCGRRGWKVKERRISAPDSEEEEQQQAAAAAGDDNEH